MRAVDSYVTEIRLPDNSEKGVEHCRRKNGPAIAATKSRRVRMDGGCLCLSTNKNG
jgi:hypothetical protein